MANPIATYYFPSEEHLKMAAGRLNQQFGGGDSGYENYGWYKEWNKLHLYPNIKDLDKAKAIIAECKGNKS